jgi:putative two-component system response regulator
MNFPDDPVVLIVDDNEASRQTLAALLLPDAYRVHFAANGPEALTLAADLWPDVILLDQMMPGMTGVEVCQRIRQNPDLAEIPVVFVTALDDRETRLEAFRAGADDVVTKPVDRVEVRMRVRNITRLNRYRNLVQSREDVHRMLAELESAYDATIRGWAQALEFRDAETRGHSDRVTQWAMTLAARLGFDSAGLQEVWRGAQLHDIGKMGVPDSILLKPGPLTPEERREMERHPTLARDLIEPIAYLAGSIHIPYSHHERWDGNGYPQGLRGEEIPLAARLFSVVDVFDALTSDRPYRRAWSLSRTLAYIRDEAGRQFDPMCVDTFLALVEENPDGIFFAGNVPAG